MLTELIEEYAKRYVDISLSFRHDAPPSLRWQGHVKSENRYTHPRSLPVFSFDLYAPTLDEMTDNFRRTTALCEPIVAHRERFLNARAADARKRREEEIKVTPLTTDAAGNLQPNTGAIQ